MSTAAISITDLSYSYGEKEAVVASSFEVGVGEVFGLLGPNGAGKTTTLSLLAGIKNPSKGKVLIFGRDLRTDPVKAKVLIGVVPQSLALYPTITARDNLEFFCGIYGITGSRAAERIKVVLETVGLHDRADEVVDTYSGGMKRRLNIAIALLHEPRILLMDEPTVGVDPQSRNHIFDCIEQLSRSGTTVIYSTHYMEEAERLCRRVAIMDHGKIVAIDTPGALCRTIGAGFFTAEVTSGNPALLAEALATSPSIRDIKATDSLMEVEANVLQDALAEFIEGSNRMAVRIASLRIFEPTLEAVFLKMTGNQLRDV